jgi:DNA repair ATPase RecN
MECSEIQRLYNVRDWNQKMVAATEKKIRAENESLPTTPKALKKAKARIEGLKKTADRYRANIVALERSIVALERSAA